MTSSNDNDGVGNLEAPGAMNLDRLHVMDIKTLSKPQENVRAALTATALILGHFPEETQDWRKLMLVLFKHGSQYIREVTLALDPASVPLDRALGAKSIMDELDKSRLECTIPAGKELWRWNTSMIAAVLSQYSQEEICSTKPRMKKDMDS